MIDQYVKLFSLDWLEPWIVEAVTIVLGALLLGFVVCKVTDCITGDK